MAGEIGGDGEGGALASAGARAGAEASAASGDDADAALGVPRFTLVDGGKRGPGIRVLVFDADTAADTAAADAAAAALSGVPFVSDEEAALLRQLAAAGVALVCVTAAREVCARSVFTAARIHLQILSDERAGRMPAGRLTRGAARVHALLAESDKTLTNLRETCVIASHPADCDLLLEAGMAFALEGAGYRARAAADAVFPAREAGGLALALGCALAWTASTAVACSR